MAKWYGGEKSKSASDMAINTFGNIYMMGTFSSETTFGDISLTAFGQSALFVTKTNSSGDVTLGKTIWWNLTSMCYF